VKETPQRLEFWGVFVSPSERGKGIGRGAFSRQGGPIPRKICPGSTVILLTVFYERNRRLSSFIRIWGFHSYGIEPHALMVGETVMFDGTSHAFGVGWISHARMGS